jgi:hypothetical protein
MVRRSTFDLRLERGDRVPSGVRRVNPPKRCLVAVESNASCASSSPAGGTADDRREG